MMYSFYNILELYLFICGLFNNVSVDGTVNEQFIEKYIQQTLFNPVGFNLDVG
jgi:hypothetical protein